MIKSRFRLPNIGATTLQDGSVIEFPAEFTEKSLAQCQYVLASDLAGDPCKVDITTIGGGTAQNLMSITDNSTTVTRTINGDGKVIFNAVGSGSGVNPQALFDNIGDTSTIERRLSDDGSKLLLTAEIFEEGGVWIQLRHTQNGNDYSLTSASTPMSFRFLDDATSYHEDDYMSFLQYMGEGYDGPTAYWYVGYDYDLETGALYVSVENSSTPSYNGGYLVATFNGTKWVLTNTQPPDDFFFHIQQLSDGVELTMDNFYGWGDASCWGAYELNTTKWFYMNYSTVKKTLMDMDKELTDFQDWFYEYGWHDDRSIRWRTREEAGANIMYGLLTKKSEGYVLPVSSPFCGGPIVKFPTTMAWWFAVLQQDTPDVFNDGLFEQVDGSTVCTVGMADSMPHALHWNSIQETENFYFRINTQKGYGTTGGWDMENSNAKFRIDASLSDGFSISMEKDKKRVLNGLPLPQAGILNCNYVLAMNDFDFNYFTVDAYTHKIKTIGGGGGVDFAPNKMFEVIDSPTHIGYKEGKVLGLDGDVFSSYEREIYLYDDFVKTYDNRTNTGHVFFAISPDWCWKIITYGKTQQDNIFNTGISIRFRDYDYDTKYPEASNFFAFELECWLFPQELHKLGLVIRFLDIDKTSGLPNHDQHYALGRWDVGSFNNTGVPPAEWQNDYGDWEYLDADGSPAWLQVDPDKERDSLISTANAPDWWYFSGELAFAGIQEVHDKTYDDVMDYLCIGVRSISGILVKEDKWRIDTMPNGFRPQNVDERTAFDSFYSHAINYSEAKSQWQHSLEMDDEVVDVKWLMHETEKRIQVAEDYLIKHITTRSVQTQGKTNFLQTRNPAIDFLEMVEVDRKWEGQPADGHYKHDTNDNDGHLPANQDPYFYNMMMQRNGYNRRFSFSCHWNKKDLRHGSGNSLSKKFNLYFRFITPIASSVDWWDGLDCPSYEMFEMKEVTDTGGWSKQWNDQSPNDYNQYIANINWHNRYSIGTEEYWTSKSAGDTMYYFGGLTRYAPLTGYEQKSDGSWGMKVNVKCHGYFSLCSTDISNEDKPHSVSYVMEYTARHSNFESELII